MGRRLNVNDCEERAEDDELFRPMCVRPCNIPKGKALADVYAGVEQLWEEPLQLGLDCVQRRVRPVSSSF
jgi:hypothetical protein